MSPPCLLGLLDKNLVYRSLIAKLGTISDHIGHNSFFLVTKRRKSLDLVTFSLVAQRSNNCREWGRNHKQRKCTEHKLISHLLPPRQPRTSWNTIPATGYGTGQHRYRTVSFTTDSSIRQYLAKQFFSKPQKPHYRSGSTKIPSFYHFLLPSGVLPFPLKSLGFSHLFWLNTLLVQGIKIYCQLSAVHINRIDRK